MEIAAYLRVSKEDLSTEQQKAAILTLLEKMNISPEAVQWYDEKKSGKNIEARDQFSWLLRKIEGGKVEKLFVYTIDRLSRNMWDLGAVLSTIIRAGCRLYFAAPGQQSLNDLRDDDIMKDFMMMFLGMVGHMERKNTQMRTKARLDYQRIHGIVGGRHQVNLDIKLLEEAHKRHARGESWEKIAASIACPQCTGTGKTKEGMVCKTCRGKRSISRNTLIARVRELP